MIWGRLFKNKKNGKIYQAFAQAVDATNGTNGRDMIVYMDDHGIWYVRERNEFNEKFESCE